MVRKLAFKLLSLLLILPSAAFALGLGDIQLHSALNQPFRADVELLSVAPADLDSIKVELAPYETFARIGLERPAVLMFLKFGVEARGGRTFATITSKEPIKEPFLDFLLQVTWHSGQLLREYTVLIDPPGMAKETPPAVQAPSAAMAPAAAPVAVAQPAPEAVPPTGAPAPMAAAAPRGGLRYGPVKADDTLWSIAVRMRPDRSITPQQMMVALLKANPQAFYDNNVNRLKKGYVLRLDDPSLISAINQAEAVREIAQQNRAWQDYMKQAADAAAERPSAATSAQAARAVAAPEAAHLKLVAPAGEAKATAGGTQTEAGAAAGMSAETLHKELLLAQETSEAQKRENEELRKRMQELEGQLSSMQRLLSLKDSDLAALQQQMHGGEKGAAAPATAAAPTAPEAAAVPPTAEQKPAPEAAPAAPAAPTAEAQTGATAPATVAPTPTETTPTPPEAAPEAPKPAAPKPVAPKPVVAPQPVAEPSLLETVTGDPMMLAGVGGVALALLLLVFLMIKRRRAGGPGFSESILTAGGTSILNSKATPGAPSEESSLFSDLAVSGMNSMQGTEAEVDPLTEADVYMAYGRYQQAEDLLKEAIKAHGERHDLKVKLLEVYYATKEREPFETLANEVFSALEGSGPLWSRVLVMGHELCPDNPMFSAEPEPGAELSLAGEGAPSSDVLDIGIDLDALAADMESSEGAGGFNLDLGVDFSDLEEAHEAPAAAAQPAAPEFDIAGLEETTAAEALEPPAEEIALADLDFGMPEAEAAPAEEEHAAVMDFDLGELELGAEPAAEAEVEAVPAVEMAEEPEAGPLDFDMGELNLDLETGGEAAPAVGAAELGDLGDLGDLGELDLGDLDAVGTKLDLAKAYVDMGEPDSARSILGEVLQEGNDEQKKQAQALMGQLG